MQETEAAAAHNRAAVPEVTLRFSSDAVREPRRYDQPAVEEVAAVFVGADGHPPSHKDIVVYPRGQEKHRVSELNPDVDPMSYILLFPRKGPPGWCPDLKHYSNGTQPAAIRTRLTTLQFYAHQLMRRKVMKDEEAFTSILPHAAGRLFPQYCVDAYCQETGPRLPW